MVLTQKTGSLQPGTHHWYSAAVFVDLGSVTVAQGSPICNDNAVSFRHIFRHIAVALFRQQIWRICIVDVVVGIRETHNGHRTHTTQLRRNASKTTTKCEVCLATMITTKLVVITEHIEARASLCECCHCVDLIRDHLSLWTTTERIFTSMCEPRTCSSH